MKIRVLIADDSPVMRKAVRQLLSEEPGIEIVGEATSFAQMLAMKEQFKPEVVVMDLHMIEECDVEPTNLSSEGSHVLAISICDPEDGVRKAKDWVRQPFSISCTYKTHLSPKFLNCGKRCSLVDTKTGDLKMCTILYRLLN